jgi:hypothetical protein
MREQSSRERAASKEQDRQYRMNCLPNIALPDLIADLRRIPIHE